MAVKIQISSQVQVELTSDSGRVYAATAHNEETARAKLAEILHDGAKQAFAEFQTLTRLANSLD